MGVALNLGFGKTGLGGKFGHVFSHPNQSGSGIVFVTYAGSPFSWGEGEEVSALPSTSSSSMTFAVQSGALPTGVTLNPTTGEISGTPTAVGAWSAVIEGTDENLATATASISGTVLSLAASSGFFTSAGFCANEWI